MRYLGLLFLLLVLAPLAKSEGDESAGDKTDFENESSSDEKLMGKFEKETRDDDLLARKGKSKLGYNENAKRATAVSKQPFKPARKKPSKPAGVKPQRKLTGSKLKGTKPPRKPNGSKPSKHSGSKSPPKPWKSTGSKPPTRPSGPKNKKPSDAKPPRKPVGSKPSKPPGPKSPSKPRKPAGAKSPSKPWKAAGSKPPGKPVGSKPSKPWKAAGPKSPSKPRKPAGAKSPSKPWKATGGKPPGKPVGSKPSKPWKAAGAKPPRKPVGSNPKGVKPPRKPVGAKPSKPPGPKSPIRPSKSTGAKPPTRPSGPKKKKPSGAKPPPKNTGSKPRKPPSTKNPPKQIGRRPSSQYKRRNPSKPFEKAKLPTDCSDVKKTDVQRSKRKEKPFLMYISTLNITYETSCDFISDGGGWTVFQRRVDGSTNFDRKYQDYINGFGNPMKEYWIGLRKLHHLTRDGKYELRVDMTDWKGKKAYAQYGTFSVGGYDKGYKLTVGKYKGTAGDSLAAHSGRKFTTTDKDEDGVARNCADIYKGGFWYANCLQSNPNGEYTKGSGNKSWGQGIIWKTWRSYEYSLKKIEMKFRRKS